MVTLRISADVILNGAVVIRKGSDATGQISDAQAKGAMGMSGRITVSPLYLHIDGDVVRLIGRSSARVGTNAATVAGVWLFAGVTGRSATIPPGRLVPASVYRAVTVRVPGC